jgi:hypothetical protein
MYHTISSILIEFIFLNTVKIMYSYQRSIKKISCNFNKLKFSIIAQLTITVVHVKNIFSSFKKGLGPLLYFAKKRYFSSNRLKFKDGKIDVL